MALAADKLKEAGGAKIGAIISHASVEAMFALKGLMDRLGSPNWIADKTVLRWMLRSRRLMLQYNNCRHRRSRCLPDHWVRPRSKRLF